MTKRGSVPDPLFTPRERRLIARLRTPLAVQAYLNDLPYNQEPGGRATLRSFRGVVREGCAHCLEAALFAAVVLEAHGYPPLVVSFDPVTDTPAVLKKHAKSLDADLTRWTFLTGDRDDVDRFASRFGVSISRALDDPLNITHNLRTALIDADGKLLKVYTGNEWSPDQILADLKPVVRAN